LKNALFLKIVVISVTWLIGINIISTVDGDSYVKQQDATNYVFLSDENYNFSEESIGQNVNDYKQDFYINLSYSFQEPTVYNVTHFNKTFSAVEMEGLRNFGKYGAPFLPFKSLFVLLPPGGDLDDFDIKVKTQLLDDSYHLIEPDGGVISISDEDIPINDIYIDPDIYNSSNPYPNKPVRINGLSMYRGYSIYSLDLFPVYYIPSNGLIYYHTNISICIKSSSNEGSKFFRGLDRDEELVRDIIENPSMIDFYPLGAEGGPGGERDDKLEECRYVIITSSDLSDAFKPLKDYKSHFISSKIVTLSEISENPLFWDNDPFFNDTQAQIRNFIKYAYTFWKTDYILLGGDVDKVPFRGLNGSAKLVLFSGTRWYHTSDMAADLYYAAIDGNWNNNKDSEWGESGESDYFAEVFIGRAPVGSNSQVMIFTKKVIGYETSIKPYKITLHASKINSLNEPDSRDVPYACDDWIPSSYSITALYEVDMNSQLEFVTQSLWKSQFDNDRLLILHTGNGAATKDNPTFYVLDFGIPEYLWKNDHISTLANDFYPLHTSVACNSGNFTYNDCLAEAYILTSNKGASACFFNSKVGFCGTFNALKYSGEFIERQFAEIFSKKSENLGKINQFAKQYLAGLAYAEENDGDDSDPYRWCYFTINLLGDPETPALETRPFITYVDDDFNSSTPGWNYIYFSEIQPAINATGNGGAVYVANGMYNETIWIEKSIDLIGENKNTTIINGNDNESTISLISSASSETTISGFTVSKGGVDDAGIWIGAANNVEICGNNIISNKKYGIEFHGRNITIRNNNISSNSEYGIYLFAVDSEIYENNFQNNGFGGIWIYSGKNNKILNNTINNNGEGVHVSYAENNIISGNSICNNYDYFGVSIWFSFDNVISYNNISSNDVDGVFIDGFVDGAGNNTIVGNIISENRQDGVDIAYYCENNSVCYNHITSNNNYGIQIRGDSHNNIIYSNNFYENNINAYDECSNIWNSTYPLGGNYWSDYGGQDSNDDGIGDIPYNISGGSNQDLLPLLRYNRDDVIISSDNLNHPNGHPRITTNLKGDIVVTYEKSYNNSFQSIPIWFSNDQGKSWMKKFDAASPIRHTDWWPMFHHDSLHSGYADSPAPITNQIKWTYTTSGSIYSSPAVYDERMYICSLDSKVYCLDANTGHEIWNFTTGSSIYSSPCVYDGKVFIGSTDKKVYCLNSTNGEQIWNYTTGDLIYYSSPTVYNNRLYIGSDDYKLHCLNLENGSMLWSFNTEGYIRSSPAVENGKVYFGSYDDKIYCLAADTGNSLWNYTTADNVFSSPAVADGKVYVGSNDDKVYCLDASNGSLIWSYLTSGNVRSSPAVSNGFVYVGSDGYRVYCLNNLTGNPKWIRYVYPFPFQSSPAVADDKVYIGSDIYGLYCLDSESGSIIWNYLTGENVFSSPAIVDGKVFVGSLDNSVYCFCDANEPSGLYKNPSIAFNPTNNMFIWSTIDPLADNFMQGWIQGDIASAKDFETYLRSIPNSEDYYNTSVTWVDEYMVNLLICNNTDPVIGCCPNVEYRDSWFNFPPNIGGSYYDGQTVFKTAPASYIESATGKDQIHVVMQYINQTTNKSEIAYKATITNLYLLLTEGGGLGDSDQYANIEYWPWHKYIAKNATDPDISAYENTVCIVYAQGGNVNCSYSIEGGKKWSESVVALDAGFPSVHVSSDGVYCAYIRNGNLYFVKSKDKGKSWSKELRVNDINGTVVETEKSIDICKAGVVWMDNRDGFNDIFFSSLLKDLSSPEIRNQGQDKQFVKLDNEILLYAQGRDELALDMAWLATNETGSWKNFTNDEWWNNNWMYRKQLHIDDPISDYQMLIKVYREDGHDDIINGTIDCDGSCTQNRTENVSRDKVWDVNLIFTEPGGNSDYAVFGEASDANDGPPADSYDAPKPPIPTSPYIRAWFDDNLETPFNRMLKDYRKYPDTYKVWNLTVQWVEDNENPTTINISWNKSEFDDCEYDSVILYEGQYSDNLVEVADMLTDVNFSYFAEESTEYYFTIICKLVNEQDFSDIRFINHNHSIILPYWIESIGTDEGDHYADIWVKTSGDEDIYMYYGNSGAYPTSNGDETFILFDDFSIDSDNEWISSQDSANSYYSRNLGCAVDNARLRAKIKANDINARNWASDADWNMGLTNISGKDMFSNNFIMYWSDADLDEGATESSPRGGIYVKNATKGEGAGHEQIVTEGNVYDFEIRFTQEQSALKIWYSSNGTLLRDFNLFNYTPENVKYQTFRLDGGACVGQNEFRWVSGNPSYLKVYNEGSHYGCGDAWQDYHIYRLFVSEFAQIEPSWSAYENVESYYNSDKYSSPMKMQENDQWQWSNFTWHNSNVSIWEKIGWRIYYMDTSGNINCTDVMEFTIVPPDHDIAVTDIEADDIAYIFEETTVNATIHNYGLNDENDVVIQLLVNETIVDSTTITSIESFEAVDVSFTWTPNKAGETDVKVYSVPVSNENITYNNFKNKTVAVKDTALPQCRNQGQSANSILQNETITLYAQGRDETALDMAWLATNESGSWNNYSWWNSDWNYRKLINISNAINGYQMMITIVYNSAGNVSLGGKCQTDFDDIRFIDYDNLNELNYWREEYLDADKAVFWIKSPDDVETDKKIWLYYGNTNVSTTSDGTETFILFDGSEDKDANEWSCWTEDNSSCSVSASSDYSYTGDYSTYVHQYNCCCGSGRRVRTYRDWVSGYNISYRDFVFEYRVFPREPSGDDTWVNWMESDGENWGNLVTQNANLWKENDPQYDDIKEFGFQTYKDYFMWNNLDEWHHVVLWHNGDNETATGILYNAEGENVHEEIDMNISNYMKSNIIDRFMIQTGRWCHSGENRLYFDNILVRNWTSGAEPSWSGFGEEEFQLYNSPMKMQENDQWQWSNFTWHNSNVSIWEKIGWRIYYMDTSGNINCTDVMEFTIVPPDHDIAVTDIEADDIAYIFEETTVNATIHNYGLNDENDVVIQLLVNETIVDSTTITSIESFEAVDVSFTWTPNKAGETDVKVYSVPVSNENITYNNFKNKTVAVKDTALPQCRNQGQSANSILQNETITLYAQGRDETALDMAWLATNESGSWKTWTNYSIEHPWFDYNWSYRKKIVINHTMVNANLTNFPMVIVDTSIDFIDHAQSDGDDFIFLNKDHTKKLNHTIEYYNNTIGKLVVWVNISNLNADNDTILYLYYGNSNCQNQENISGTWSSDFIAVWHLNNDPSDGVGAITDETLNQNDGTGKNMESHNLIDGKVGKALSFDGINEYVEVPQDPSLEPTDLTMIGWVYPRNLTSGSVFCTKSGDDKWYDYNYDGHPYAFYRRDYGSDGVFDAGGFFEVDDGLTQHNMVGCKPIYNNNWYHFALCFSDSISKGYFYVNGSLNESKDIHNSALFYDLGYGFHMAGYCDGTPHSPTINRFVNCSLDEIWILKTNMSGEWISTIYNNQNDPFLFFNIEDEVCRYNYSSPKKLNKDNKWQWTNFTWQNSSIPNGTVIGWQIYYNDTSGNLNSTNVMSFIVGDSIPPTISNISIEFSNPKDTEPDFGWENITCKVADNANVDLVWLNVTYPDFHMENKTMILASGGIYYYNTTFSNVGCYNYFICANDTIGNTNASNDYSFEVPPNWDVTMDGVCNIIDLSKVSAHFHETGPYGWIREDIDNNGIINIIDLSICSLHFHNTWETCSGKLIPTVITSLDSGFVKIDIIPPLNNVKTGELFEVNVYINPENPVSGLELDLSYDANIIQIISTEGGDFFENHTSLFDNGVIDNINGIMTGVYGLCVDDIINKPSIFCTMTFIAKNIEGTTELNIHNIIVTDIKGDSKSEKNLYIQNGIVTVSRRQPNNIFRIS